MKTRKINVIMLFVLVIFLTNNNFAQNLSTKSSLNYPIINLEKEIPVIVTTKN